MRRWILRLLLLSLAALAAAAWITRPRADGPDVLAGLTGDAASGEVIFTAAGCTACHMAEGATGAAQRVLSGGQVFASPYGSFTAPNISQDTEAGIGDWEAIDLWNALHYGTSPEGQHYYPAFPYASYTRMTKQQVVDLYAFLQTLPADATHSRPHDLPFVYSIRAALGGWKLLYLRDAWVMQGPLPDEEQRGRVLVEALGHCAECHSPRSLAGGVKTGANWLTGAPNPSGKGRIPDLTPPALSWTRDELVEYFTSGFTPDFDVAGGHMGHVVEALAKLPKNDREAIAAYLKRLPLEG